jgi:hypothetical protein
MISCRDGERRNHPIIYVFVLSLAGHVRYHSALRRNHAMQEIHFEGLAEWQLRRMCETVRKHLLSRMDEPGAR